MTLDYDALDPGIRDVVRLLREHGFDTRDSGDGISKPLDSEGVLRFPHVVCVVEPHEMYSEARRLNALAKTIGPEWRVEASWLVGSVAIITALRDL